MTGIVIKGSRLADDVAEQRESVDVGKALLTALFVVPFVLGWLAWACWSALAWTWAAAVVGFRTAQRGASSEDTPA